MINFMDCYLTTKHFWQMYYLIIIGQNFIMNCNFVCIDKNICRFMFVFKVPFNVLVYDKYKYHNYLCIFYVKVLTAI